MKVKNIPNILILGFLSYRPGISFVVICSCKPQHVALDYVISNNYIDHAIIGVENLRSWLILLR